MPPTLDGWSVFKLVWPLMKPQYMFVWDNFSPCFVGVMNDAAALCNIHHFSNYGVSSTRVGLEAAWLAN